MGLNIGQVDPSVLQKLFYGGPQSMFAPPDQQKPTPQTDPSAPQRGSVAQAMQSAPPAEPTAPQPTPQAQPTAQPPHVPSFDEYHTAHGDVPIGGAPPPAPKHGMLAKIMLGLGEALGNPLATRIGERDRSLSQENQQYEANKPALQYQANRGAYESEVGDIQKTGGIAQTAATTSKTLQELENMRHSPPGKEEFLQKFSAALKAGEEDPQQVYQQYLALSHTVPGMSRQDLTDVANSTPEAPPQFKIGTQGIREPLRYHGQTWYGNEPTAPQNIKDAAAAAANVEKQVHTNKLQEQSAAASHIQLSNELQTKTHNLETGQKSAQEALTDLHKAQNQQKLIEDLAKDPGNDAKQVALMMQMAGVERPQDMTRMPPALVEELKTGGSLSERAARILMNWKSGDVLPRQMIPELVESAKVLTDTKAKNANDALQSNFETYGYKHPGTGPRGRMDEVQQNQQGTQPKGATHTGIGSEDKKKHWLDAQGNDLGLAE